MERSAIRESQPAAPDFAALHPGYKLTTTVIALNAAKYWIIRFRG
jgi:hypothetical protein